MTFYYVILFVVQTTDKKVSMVYGCNENKGCGAERKKQKIRKRKNVQATYPNMIHYNGHLSEE